MSKHDDIHPCIVIPTYNNAGTLAGVVRRAIATGLPVIVVNDGSTDGTYGILKRFDDITVLSYSPNRGKGHALQAGLDTARQLGYTHAVTVDSDGQHYPEDAVLLTDTARSNPGAIIIGQRSGHDGYKSRGSKFANAFSDFWFSLQTFTRGLDTQSGFRCYPLTATRMRFYTSRYEAELAALVSARWRGVPLLQTAVRVYYPLREERVSHFRPGRDFARISVLNTVLCLLAAVYGYPSMLYHKIKTTWRRG